MDNKELLWVQKFLDTQIPNVNHGDISAEQIQQAKQEVLADFARSGGLAKDYNPLYGSKDAADVAFVKGLQAGNPAAPQTAKQLVTGYIFGQRPFKSSQRLNTYLGNRTSDAARYAKSPEQLEYLENSDNADEAHRRVDVLQQSTAIVDPKHEDHARYRSLLTSGSEGEDFQALTPEAQELMREVRKDTAAMQSYKYQEKRAGYDAVMERQKLGEDSWLKAVPGMSSAARQTGGFAARWGKGLLDDMLGADIAEPFMVEAAAERYKNNEATDDDIELLAQMESRGAAAQKSFEEDYGKETFANVFSSVVSMGIASGAAAKGAKAIGKGASSLLGTSRLGNMVAGRGTAMKTITKAIAGSKNTGLMAAERKAAARMAWGGMQTLGQIGQQVALRAPVTALKATQHERAAIASHNALYADSPEEQIEQGSFAEGYLTNLGVDALSIGIEYLGTPTGRMLSRPLAKMRKPVKGTGLSPSVTGASWLNRVGSGLKTAGIGNPLVELAEEFATDQATFASGLTDSAPLIDDVNMVVYGVGDWDDLSSDRAQAMRRFFGMAAGVSVIGGVGSALSVYGQIQRSTRDNLIRGVSEGKISRKQYKKLMPKKKTTTATTAEERFEDVIRDPDARERLKGWGVIPRDLNFKIQSIEGEIRLAEMARNGEIEAPDGYAVTVGEKLSAETQRDFDAAEYDTSGAAPDTDPLSVLRGSHTMSDVMLERRRKTLARLKQMQAPGDERQLTVIPIVRPSGNKFPSREGDVRPDMELTWVSEPRLNDITDADLKAAAGGGPINLDDPVSAIIQYPESSDEDDQTGWRLWLGTRPPSGPDLETRTEEGYHFVRWKADPEVMEAQGKLGSLGANVPGRRLDESADQYKKRLTLIRRNMVMQDRWVAQQIAADYPEMAAALKAGSVDVQSILKAQFGDDTVGRQLQELIEANANSLDKGGDVNPMTTATLSRLADHLRDLDAPKVGKGAQVYVLMDTATEELGAVFRKGTVEQVNEDGSINVKFGEGDTMSNVPPKDYTVESPQVGDKGVAMGAPATVVQSMGDGQLVVQINNSGAEVTIEENSFTPLGGVVTWGEDLEAVDLGVQAASVGEAGSLEDITPGGTEADPAASIPVGTDEPFPLIFDQPFLDRAGESIPGVTGPGEYNIVLNAAGVIPGFDGARTYVGGVDESGNLVAVAEEVPAESATAVSDSAPDAEQQVAAPVELPNVEEMTASELEAEIRETFEGMKWSLDGPLKLKDSTGEEVEVELRAKSGIERIRNPELKRIVSVMRQGREAVQEALSLPGRKTGKNGKKAEPSPFVRKTKTTPATGLTTESPDAAANPATADDGNQQLAQAAGTREGLDEQATRPATGQTMPEGEAIQEGAREGSALGAPTVNLFTSANWGVSSDDISKMSDNEVNALAADLIDARSPDMNNDPDYMALEGTTAEEQRDSTPKRRSAIESILIRLGKHKDYSLPRGGIVKGQYWIRTTDNRAYKIVEAGPARIVLDPVTGKKGRDEQVVLDNTGEAVQIKLAKQFRPSTEWELTQTDIESEFGRLESEIEEALAKHDVDSKGNKISAEEAKERASHVMTMIRRFSKGRRGQAWALNRLKVWAGAKGTEEELRRVDPDTMVITPDETLIDEMNKLDADVEGKYPGVFYETLGELQEAYRTPQLTQVTLKDGWPDRGSDITGLGTEGGRFSTELLFLHETIKRNWDAVSDAFAKGNGNEKVLELLRDKQDPTPEQQRLIEHLEEGENLLVGSAISTDTMSPDKIFHISDQPLRGELTATGEVPNKLAAFGDTTRQVYEELVRRLMSGNFKGAEGKPNAGTMSRDQAKVLAGNMLRNEGFVAISDESGGHRRYYALQDKPSEQLLQGNRGDKRIYTAVELNTLTGVRIKGKPKKGGPQFVSLKEQDRARLQARLEEEEKAGDEKAVKKTKTELENIAKKWDAEWENFKEQRDAHNMPRLPTVDELALPHGDVENTANEVFAAAGPDGPTSEELSVIPGAQLPRKKNDRHGVPYADLLDREGSKEGRLVEPRSYKELKEMLEWALDPKRNVNLDWYNQFGQNTQDLIGKANMKEFAALFGITSAQKAAEVNYAETLHIMDIARRIDPRSRPEEFKAALWRATDSTGPDNRIGRPDLSKDGRAPGLGITESQVNQILTYYRTGKYAGGLKVSTYMWNVLDKAGNDYSPFSVQDVHMSRVFGADKRRMYKYTEEYVDDDGTVKTRDSNYDKWAEAERAAKKGKGKKSRNPITYRVVDGAKFSKDAELRYAMYMTSRLARDYNIQPQQAQALLWFYAKENLSPKDDQEGAVVGDGTFDSATRFATKGIARIQEMVDSGEFNKDKPLYEGLDTEPTPFRSRPQRETNAESVIRKIDKALGGGELHKDLREKFTKDEPEPAELRKRLEAERERQEMLRDRAAADDYSNTNMRLGISDMVVSRSPQVTVSFNPGVERGYGFPKDVTLEELITFQDVQLEAITDSDGQIRILKELNIPHRISRTLGTYDRMEPSILINLPGMDMDTADMLANLLGDAMLQDGALTVKSDHTAPEWVADVEKKDGSRYTQQELEEIYELVNKDKERYGLNFTMSFDETALSFFDGAMFDLDDPADYSIGMQYAFYNRMKGILSKGSMDLDVAMMGTVSNYYESETTDEQTGRTETYQGRAEYFARRSGSPARSSVLLSRANDLLYEPAWEAYRQFVEERGYSPENQVGPRMERPDVPHVLTESTTLLKDETVHVAVDGAPSEGTADFFAQRKMDLHAAQDKAGLAKLAAVRADSVSVSNIDSENISGIVAGIANVMKPDGVAYVSKTHDPMTADSDLDAAIAEESEQVEELKSLLEERFGDVEDLGTHFQARDPKPSSFRVSEGTNESLRQADASADVAAYGAFNVTAKQHKAVVSLFEGGNLSTLLHELGHYFRSQLTESENRAVERIMLRENSSLRKRDNGRLDWRHNNSEAEEYFAQEFQRYVSEGKTEANELTSVFEKFKSWLKGTLLRLPNTNKLSNEMRGFFDQMLSGEERRELSERISRDTRLAQAVRRADAVEPLPDIEPAPTAAAVLDELAKLDGWEDPVKTPKGLGRYARFLFRTEKLLPRPIFRALWRMKSQIRGAERDVKLADRELKRAIKKEWGKLDERNNALLNTFLSARDTRVRQEAADQLALAPRVFKAATEIRDKIDGVSRQLQKSGAIQDDILKATVDANMQVYLNRSYRFFEEPKTWTVKHVRDKHPDRWMAAVDWLRGINQTDVQKNRVLVKTGSHELRADVVEVNQQEGTATVRYMDKSKAQVPLTDMEAITVKSDEDLNREVADLLDRGTGQGPALTRILGEKDLGILKQKKEVPEALRRLWGEYEDVSDQVVNTLTKMSKLQAEHKFLDTLKRHGMGKFFFEKGKQPVPAVPIKADGNPKMEPLAGLYTYDWLLKELQTHFDPRPPSQDNERVLWLARQVKRAIATTKVGLTVYSTGTQIKNFASNPLIQMASGNWDLRKAWKAGRTIIDDWASTPDPEKREFVKKMYTLGVIDSGVNLQDVMANLDAANRDGLDKFVSSQKVLRGAKKAAIDAPMALYQAGDVVWKIYAFENFKARYGKVFPDMKDKQLDQYAATLVLEETPSTAMANSQLLRTLRWMPMGSTFITFTAEMYRVTGNQIKRCISELKSDNPELKKSGFKRLIGLSTAMDVTGLLGYTLLDGLVAALGGASVPDDDDKEDYWTLGRPWDASKLLAHKSTQMVKDEKGDNVIIRLLPYSNIHAYGSVRDVVQAVMSGLSDDEASGLEVMTGVVSNVVGAGMEQFLDGNILAETWSEVSGNQDAYGNKIIQPLGAEQPNWYQVLFTPEGLTYTLKKLGPAPYKQWKRLQKSSDPNALGHNDWSESDAWASLYGLTVSTVDVRDQTARAYRSAKYAEGSAKKKLLNWLRVSRSPEEARELYGKASEQLRLQQEHARKVVASAERQGLPSQVIDKLAWQEGAGKKGTPDKEFERGKVLAGDLAFTNVGDAMAETYTRNPQAVMAMVEQAHALGVEGTATPQQYLMMMASREEDGKPTTEARIAGKMLKGYGGVNPLAGKKIGLSKAAIRRARQAGR